MLAQIIRYATQLPEARDRAVAWSLGLGLAAVGGPEGLQRHHRRHRPVPAQAVPSPPRASRFAEQAFGCAEGHVEPHRASSSARVVRSPPPADRTAVDTLVADMAGAAAGPADAAGPRTRSTSASAPAASPVESPPDRTAGPRRPDRRAVEGQHDRPGRAEPPTASSAITSSSRPARAGLERRVHGRDRVGRPTDFKDTEGRAGSSDSCCCSAPRSC